MSGTIDDALLKRFDLLTENGRERVQRNNQVALARSGDIQSVMPGVFPATYPKPIIANIIDTTARDLAEILARMPAIDCASSQLHSEAAKKFSSKRTKIAHAYIEHSRLKLQLYSGCDWFFSFAAMPIIVEPDFKDQIPCLRIDDPRNAYWETDLYGNVRAYAKVWEDTCASLCAKFPELEADIYGPKFDPFGAYIDRSNDRMRVAKLYVDNRIIMFLPERKGLILSDVTHRLDRPPVVVAERPKWDKDNRGQFDDVMWVWLARARMAIYGLEAADKAVRAPLIVPDDVDQISFGADAVIRTNNPQGVGRAKLDLPNAALIEPQLLDKEVADGTRTPAARRGDVDASIITGRGVEALTSIYQTQIATAQDIVGDSLRRALGMAFEMDELYWGDVRKSVKGTISGAPFTETYVPSKDIKGDYSVSVTYGMTAGMDPNRAIVFLLQLRADQAIDRDTMQRQLPFDVDVEDLQRRIDIEQIEDALKQGLFGLLANAPALSVQGIDPLQTLQRAAQIVKARENGTPVHEAILKAFTPEEQAQPSSPEEQAMQQLRQLAGGGGAPPEQQPGDNSYLGAGAAPDVSMILAGLTSGGNPNLQATVSRRLPA